MSEFDKALDAIFEARASEFSDELRELLRQLFEEGSKEGRCNGKCRFFEEGVQLGRELERERERKRISSDKHLEDFQVRRSAFFEAIETFKVERRAEQSASIVGIDYAAGRGGTGIGVHIEAPAVAQTAPTRELHGRWIDDVPTEAELEPREVYGRGQGRWKQTFKP